MKSDAVQTCLPHHGRVECSACYKNEGRPVHFDKTQRTLGQWRITANPLAWGNTAPEIIVLGFSKGPTQAGALATTPHDKIAYKGSRLNVGRILAHIGLLPKGEPASLAQAVDLAIANRNGRFHFASLIRCTVERLEAKTAQWKGSGGGMLDKFTQSELGHEVVSACTSRFLGALPPTTKLVVMFGLGSKQGYVNAAFSAYQHARPGAWRKLNEVSYTDGLITVVHVEHFKSQGNLIPDWLGQQSSARAQLGVMAKQAVSAALQ
ncbi:MAG: hypothetical protein ABIP34_05470 [Rhodoferax sp.]|uniref:hypothetical protein n=1 Tax=Rhodoferax sp. TaxID=50421 RepID=UPI003265692B